MIETRPVHEQLLSQCQRDLAAGRWAVGERFPSERELAQAHGISRATANKVLAKLASEGWLELRKGVGTFVAERPTLFASLQRLESFTDFTGEQGYTPSTEVLLFDTVDTVPAGIAVRLPEEPGWYAIERLRRADGEALILERRWLPARRYPGLERGFLKGSFYQLCRERYGLLVERQEATLRAVFPPEHSALNWDCPALRLRGTGYGSDGDLLWAEELFYRGDRFSFCNHVASHAAVPQFSIRLS